MIKLYFKFLKSIKFKKKISCFPNFKQKNIGHLMKDARYFFEIKNYFDVFKMLSY